MRTLLTVCMHSYISYLYIDYKPSIEFFQAPGQRITTFSQFSKSPEITETSSHDLSVTLGNNFYLLRKREPSKILISI